MKKNKVLTHTKRRFLKIYDDHFEWGDKSYSREEVTLFASTHRYTECAKHYDMSLCEFKHKIVKTWHLKKSQEVLNKLTEETLLKKYGDAHFNNQEKAKETMRKKYGSLKNAYRLNYEHGKQTKKRLYGDENYNNKEKNKQTCLERYGVDNVYKAKVIKEKMKQTCLEKYGVEYTTQIKEANEKRKQTFLERYGSTCYLTSKKELKHRNSKKCREENQKKIKATIQQHLQENPNYYQDIRAKSIETRRKNNTLSTSKPEEDYYKYLCSKFNPSDIYREYTEKRYPFHCDFYIKSLDLFIELNIYFTHGGHPFNKDDVQDLKLLEKIRSKQALTKKGLENSYYVYEHVWTQSDVKKLNTFKTNKLNYRIIYPNMVVTNFKEI